MIAISFTFCNVNLKFKVTRCNILKNNNKNIKVK